MNKKLLLLIFFACALDLIVEQVLGSAASKAAVKAAGLKSICELSAELKGVGKYMANKLKKLEGRQDELRDQTSRLLEGLKLKKRNCTLATILENYLTLKQEKISDELEKVSELSVKAATGAAYAAGRIDEFPYILAGMNTDDTLGGSDHSCFVKGSGSSNTAGVTQANGVQDEDVGKCFQTPQHKDIPDSGVLQFDQHLGAQKTHDTFLTSSALHSTGCVPLTMGSSKMFDANGPATWLVAGGIIKFDASSNNLDASVIQAHGTVLDGSKGSNPFTEAKAAIGLANDAIRGVEQTLNELFQQRTLERLEADEEFKRALYIGGLLNVRDGPLRAEYHQIYELLLKEMENVRETSLGGADVEELDRRRRQTAIKYCADSRLGDPIEEAPTPTNKSSSSTKESNLTPPASIAHSAATPAIDELGWSALVLMLL